jgi:hypothetical protein
MVVAWLWRVIKDPFHALALVISVGCTFFLNNLWPNLPQLTKPQLGVLFFVVLMILELTYWFSRRILAAIGGLWSAIKRIWP